MVKLIGDLMINEYELGGHKFRITLLRQTAELLSIVVDSEYMGQQTSQVYYGPVAREIQSELLKFKMQKALGLDITFNMDKFNRKGISFQMNEVWN